MLDHQAVFCLIRRSSGCFKQHNWVKCLSKDNLLLISSPGETFGTYLILDLLDLLLMPSFLPRKLLLRA